MMKLMAKFITLSNKDEPLQIKSVVAPEGVKGYIYIEAYKQTHVKQAIEGIGNLRMGLYTQQVSHGAPHQNRYSASHSAVVCNLTLF